MNVADLADAVPFVAWVGIVGLTVFGFLAVLTRPTYREHRRPVRRERPAQPDSVRRAS